MMMIPRRIVADREEIAQEVQEWMDNVGPVIGDAGIVKSIVEFIRNPNG